MANDVGSMTDGEDWISRASRESNEALAKKAAQAPASIKAKRPSKAEEPGSNLPKAVQAYLKGGRILNRVLIKTLPDGEWSDAATPHLRLDVKGNGRSYVFRYKNRLTGKEVYPGLGSIARDLEDVRDDARKMNRWLADGKDPVRELEKEAKSVVTVNQVIDEYFEIQIKPNGPGYVKRVRETDLGLYLRPALGAVPIAEVSRDVFKTAGWGPEGISFHELWCTKHTTAAHIRMHINRVWERAAEEGYIHVNPFTPGFWKNYLPRRKIVHRVQHHDAADFREAYAFVRALRASRQCDAQKMKYWSPAAQKYAWVRALKAMIIEFQFYCGVRHDEIRRARWKEIDWKTLTWTPPRTKNEIVRGIPITPPMLEILEERRRQVGKIDPEALIFPGPNDKPIAAGMMSTFLRRHVRWPKKSIPTGRAARSAIGCAPTAMTTRCGKSNVTIRSAATPTGHMATISSLSLGAKSLPPGLSIVRRPLQNRNESSPMKTIEKAEIAAIEPLLCSIQAATKVLGRSERWIFHAIATGEIKAVKSDRRTLIVVQSLKDYAASLPAAKGTPNNYRPKTLAIA